MASFNDSGSTPARPRSSDWVAGELLEHGPARYQFQDSGSPSYFIKLRTFENEVGARRRLQEARDAERPIDGRTERRPWTPDDGGVRTLWGTDLKRAVEQSKSRVQIGQIVAARVVGRDRLEPDPKRSGQDGRVFYKNRWEVETPQFIRQRQQFARAVNDSYQGARRQGGNDPEAQALYLIHEGARRLAEHRYPNPDDQQRFLARVRNFLEVSPEREVLIARAVENINRRKAERARAAGQERAADVSPRELAREPLTR